MWSGRFREPLDPDFEAWQRSLPFDWQLLPQEIAASKAHAQTIAAAGILTAGELNQVLAHSMRSATTMPRDRRSTHRTGAARKRKTFTTLSSSSWWRASAIWA